MPFLDDIGLQKYTSKLKDFMKRFVPVTRKINGKPLSSDVTLALSDIEMNLDEGLTLEDETLGLENPVRGIISQEDFDALPEEMRNKGTYIILGGNYAQLPNLTIEEYDTEDGWHVRKWSDGYVEMCITKFYVSQTTEAISIGELYALSGCFPHLSYPIALVERYCEVAQYQPYSDRFLAGWVVSKGVANQYDLTQTMEYSMYRSSPFPNDGYDWHIGINIKVNGRWKSKESTYSVKSDSVSASINNEITVSMPDSVYAPASTAKEVTA